MHFFLIYQSIKNKSNHVNVFFTHNLEICFLAVDQWFMQQVAYLMLEKIAISMTFVLVGLMMYLIYLDRTGKL